MHFFRSATGLVRKTFLKFKKQRAEKSHFSKGIYREKRLQEFIAKIPSIQFEGSVDVLKEVQDAILLTEHSLRAQINYCKKRGYATAKFDQTLHQRGILRAEVESRIKFLEAEQN
jgi:hypothetical protein